jgi:Ca2+-binding RTX toxin-like protein
MGSKRRVAWAVSAVTAVGLAGAAVPASAGVAGDIAAAAAARFDGAQSDTNVGLSLAAIGDFNGDAREDLAFATGGARVPQAVEIVLGHRGLRRLTLGSGASKTIRLAGPEGMEHHPLDVAAAGDVNGDNLADIVVGASNASPRGRSHAGAAFVVFGSRRPRGGRLGDPRIAGFTIHGPSDERRVGTSVDGAGDVNTDGLADVVLGSHGPYAPNGEVAHAYVVYGRESSSEIDLAAPGTGGFEIATQRPRDAVVDVAGVGDVNGDRHDDVVAMFGADPPEAHVVFGGGSAGSVDLTVTPDAGIRISGGSFGNPAGAGDFNDDGRADIGFGTPAGLASEPCPFTSECGLGPAHSNPGGAVVVFGSQAGTVNVHDLGRHGVTIERRGHGDDYAGEAVTGVRDFDADGYDDLALGAPGESRVWVVRGGPQVRTLQLRPAGPRVIRFDGIGVRSAGVALASIRDWDRDRLPDLLIGAPLVESNEGRAFVVRGFRLGVCRNERLGTRRSESLGGTMSGDALAGKGGRDTLEGLEGRDCLFGGRGRDELYGGPGSDTIVDRHGPNRVEGNRGRDRIDARNGARDRVYCGLGRDTLRADRRDFYLDCELVDVPPGPPSRHEPCKNACAVSLRTDPSG